MQFYYLKIHLLFENTNVFINYNAINELNVLNFAKSNREYFRINVIISNQRN